MESVLILLWSILVLGLTSGGSSVSLATPGAEDDPRDLVDDHMIAKCLDDGDKEAYNRAKMARHTLSQCSTSLLHSDQVLMEVRAAMLSGGRGLLPVVRRFCGEYQASGQRCLRGYLEDLLPCVNSTHAQIEQLMVAMAVASWEYACHGDAVRVSEFLRDATLACLHTHTPGLALCVAPYAALLGAGDPSRAVAELLVNGQCSTVAKVTACVTRTLAQCEDATAWRLVRGSLSRTLAVSPCAGADAVEPVVGHRSGDLLERLEGVVAGLQELHERDERRRERLDAGLEAAVGVLEGGGQRLEAALKAALRADRNRKERL